MTPEEAAQLRSRIAQLETRSEVDGAQLELCRRHGNHQQVRLRALENRLDEYERRLETLEDQVGKLVTGGVRLLGSQLTDRVDRIEGETKGNTLALKADASTIRELRKCLDEHERRLQALETPPAHDNEPAPEDNPWRPWPPNSYLPEVELCVDGWFQATGKRPPGGWPPTQPTWRWREAEDDLGDVMPEHGWKWSEKPPQLKRPVLHRHLHQVWHPAFPGHLWRWIDGQGRKIDDAAEDLYWRPMPPLPGEERS